MSRYRDEINAARTRLAARDREYLASEPFGIIEYAQHGDGPALLVSHPLFGGFDAGIGLAETYVGDGFRIVAPSRFGYLGSTLPPKASPALQADAYVALLDTLGIERAALFGYSAGGPAVIQFALRHPDRTCAMTLMASALPGRAGRPPKPVAHLLFGSDPFFWALGRFLPAQFSRLLGLPRGLHLTPDQRTTLLQTEIGLLPVRERKRGVLFDIYVSNPAVQQFPLGEIRVPTLVISAKDDPMSAYDNSADAAQWIPGARLLTVDTGGHLLLGSEQRIRDEIQRFSTIASPTPASQDSSTRGHQ